jgi:hypothetical protein
VNGLGLYLVACGLLVGAGAAKAIRPDDTARALAQLTGRSSLTAARRGVRAAAALEGMLGLAGLVYPNRIAAAGVAASYVAFSLFVLVARRRGAVLATCGCFGQPDTPPTRTHAAVDAVLAAGAAAVAWAGPAAWITTVLGRQYRDGGPLVAAAALCGWLAYLALSPLARLGARRANLHDAVVGGVSA